MNALRAYQIKAAALVAVLLVSLFLCVISAVSSEQVNYALKLKPAVGDVVPLTELTVYGDASWSYSLNSQTVSGTIYSGQLPPKPDIVAGKLAMFEVTKDEGATGLRGVFNRFPAGGTLLVYKDGKLFCETKFFLNPETK